jgi:hypothetical protein
MKRFLHSEIWWLYSEIVHQFLFLEIMSHGVLETLSRLLAAAAAVTEDNKSLVAFCAAILLSLINMVRHRPAKKPELPKKLRTKGHSGQRRITQARDKQGRFTRVEKRNRRT